MLQTGGPPLRRAQSRNSQIDASLMRALLPGLAQLKPLDGALALRFAWVIERHALARDRRGAERAAGPLSRP